jgi:excisionase family DNA binding protein
MAAASSATPTVQPQSHKATGEQLSVEQVATEVGVTSCTVRRWIHNGELQAARIGPAGKGRIFRVARRVLDEFIGRRLVDPVVRDVDSQADEIMSSLVKS